MLGGMGLPPAGRFHLHADWAWEGGGGAVGGPRHCRARPLPEGLLLLLLLSAADFEPDDASGGGGGGASPYTLAAAQVRSFYRPYMTTGYVAGYGTPISI
jgi:hypothetical protein